MDISGPRLSLALPLLAAVGSLAGAGLTYLATGSAPATVVGGGVVATVAVFLGVRPLVSFLSQLGRGTVGGRAPFPEMEGLALALSERDAAVAGLRKAAEEREGLLAALNSSADGIVAVDAEGKVTFLNRAAERMVSRPLEEAGGKPLAWLLPVPEVVEAMDESRVNGRRRVLSIERPNRQLLQVTSTPSAEGGTRAALLVFRDLTDVRRAEQMRRDFVANVSHELRTPLASIRAVLETLAGGAMADPAAARDFIGRAETEVDRLTRMVTDLLELSRIEAGEAMGEVEAIDTGLVTLEAVERLRSQAVRAEIDLAVEVEPEVRPVMGNGDRLERAVMNLVQNAIKFTPAGGRVRVGAGNRDGGVAIEVEDNGEGIDERDLPRIFERFYKADNSRRTLGSGLGLALVKHTAEAYGGHVTVESARGRGSKFTIILPATDKIASTSRAESRSLS